MAMYDLPISVRAVLMADAILTGIAGLAIVGMAGLAAPLLGLPTPLLQTGGAVLIGYAGVVGLSSRRSSPSATVAGAIFGNLLWAVGCFAAVVLFRESLTILGYAFLGAQVAFVLVFADLQFVCLRRQAAVVR